MADERNERRRSLHPVIAIMAAMGALALVAAVFLAIMGVVVAGKITGMSKRGAGSGVEDSSGWFSGAGSGDIVAGIRLEGTVDSLLADDIIEKLEAAHESDKRIVGILLEVNSPGGSVVASQEVYDAIKKIREYIPVVAYVREMSASGAYYSSAPSTKIVVNRSSLVGSIGVIMSSMETSSLLEWAKIRPETVKSGRLKDAGSNTRVWTADDRQYFQSIIESTHQQFVSDVTAVRKLSPETLQKMSDGRVVVGQDAVKMGLADVIGSKDDALNIIKDLAKLQEKPELWYMERTPGIWDELAGSMREGESSQSKIRGFVKSILEEVRAEFAGSSKVSMRAEAPFAVQSGKK